MRIVAAMSGGVDSSVAAALLAADGHDVVGLSMQLYDQRDGTESFGSCCTLDDLHDARRVARRIGIPHYIVNFERQFDERVVAPFVEEYAAARTPIPLRTLQQRPEVRQPARPGARIRRRAGGYRPLCAGGDRVGERRQQLHPTAPPRHRSRKGSMLLPLFTHAIPACPRQLPAGRHAEGGGPGLRPATMACWWPTSRTATRSASCPTATTRRSWKGDCPTAPHGGVVVDAAGRVLGRHHGVHRFTVGQRKGLGVSSTVPLYVTALDAASSSVTVGPRTALERTTLTAGGVNWIEGPPQPGASGHGADPPPSCAGPGPRLAGRRGRPAPRVRQSAAGDHTRPGRRDVRRRRRARRGLDRLTVPATRPDGTSYIADVAAPTACTSSAGRLSRYRSASMAAMHPEPAAVMACR